MSGGTPGCRGAGVPAGAGHAFPRKGAPAPEKMFAPLTRLHCLPPCVLMLLSVQHSRSLPLPASADPPTSPHTRVRMHTGGRT